MNYIKQTDVIAIFESNCKNSSERKLVRKYCENVWQSLKDGGVWRSPDGSFPTLTKVEAQKGWTFHA